MKVSKVPIPNIWLLVVLVLGSFAASSGLSLDQERIGEAASHDHLDDEGTPVERTDEPWPPAAWEKGHIEALSLTEMAYVLAGAAPGSPEAASVDQDLERLKDLPPEYTEVAQRSLEGLALASWHQEQARGFLSDEDVAALDGLGPGQPQTTQATEALAKLDHRHVVMAATVLTRSAEEIEAILDRPEPPSLVGDSLREGFGKADRLEPVPRVTNGPQDPGLVADLISQASDEPLDPGERDALARELAHVPREGRQAVGHILEALVPLASGSPTGPERSLIRLGDAIDASRDTLEVWAAQASATEFVDAHTLSIEELEVPDPNAEVPPLRVAHGTGSSAVEAPENLTVALETLASSFNDTATAGDAGEHMAPLEEALSQEQQETLGTVFVAMAEYVDALKAVSAAQAPMEVRENPRMVHTWASMLEEGELVLPGTEEAEVLKQAQEHLDAAVDLLNARGGLLETVEDLVPSFTQPASSSGAMDPTDPCAMNPDLQRVEVSFYFQADLCGVDQTWEKEALLTLDVGGDDLHTHRAAAPFNATERVEEIIGQTVDVGDQETWAPIALTVDIGGSDEYRPTDTTSCTLGSTCGQELVDIADCDIPFVPMGVACGRDSVAVLVDWNEDGSEAENVFVGGDQSQAVATAARSYALLLERTGQGSTLSSTYKAGDGSQGSGTREGAAVLIRLVGDGSTSQSMFSANDGSQGSTTSLLLNLAGNYTQHNDEYRADDRSQGAGSGGIFTDFAGHRSDSNDVFIAGDRSQAWSSNQASFFISGAKAGSSSDDWFEMPDGAEGRGYGGYFVSAVQPAVEPSPDGLMDQEEGTITVAPSNDMVTSSNDDVYKGALSGYGNSSIGGEGWGEGFLGLPAFGFQRDRPNGFFLDLGGEDEYPDNARIHLGGDDDFPERAVPAVPGEENRYPRDVLPFENKGPCNNCIWEWGFDGTVEDADADIFPDAIDALWPGEPLWTADPDDENESPSPTPARTLVETEPTASTVNRSYAFILSVGGDDIYTENASAGLLFDLGGEDLYEGHIGAAGFDLPQRSFSFALDLEGDDEYNAPNLTMTQGYAQTAASGLLFDLAGNDMYWANSHAQGAAAGGLGLLFDGTDPEEEETNVFRANASPSRGQGEDGGLGVLIAAGEDNRFPSGGHTVRDAIPDEDSPLDDDLVDVSTLIDDVDEECATETQWPSPGAKCSQRAGEEIETENGGTGLRLDLGAPADPTAIEELSLRLLNESDQGTDDSGQSILRVGENASFLAELTHREGDDVTFEWTFEHAEGKHTETVTKLGNQDGQQTFHAHAEHAWTRVDEVAVQTNKDGTIEHADLDQAFTVHVEARDAQNRNATAQTTVLIEHEPLPLLHLDDLPNPQEDLDPTLLLGPQEANVSPMDEPRVAYQLPVNDTRGQSRILTKASWDGASAQHQQEDVNWANSSSWWETTPAVALPEATPGIIPIFDQEDEKQLAEELEEKGEHVWHSRPAECLLDGVPGQMLDGNRTLGPTFRIAGLQDRCPAVHFRVDLPEPRQIHEISITAEVDGLSQGATFMLLGVAPNGSTETLGSLHFEDGTIQASNASVNFGVYESFLVRQQTDPSWTALEAAVTVFEFEARGPGVTVDLPILDEAVELTVEVLDEAGAINRTIEQIQIGLDLGDLEIDFDGDHPLVRVDGLEARGATHHASLVTERPYELALTPTQQALDLAGELCVEYERGATGPVKDCIPINDAPSGPEQAMRSLCVQIGETGEELCQGLGEQGDDAVRHACPEETDDEDVEELCDGSSEEGVLEEEPQTLFFFLEWQQPGSRKVYWNLTGGELGDRFILGSITTAHVEPGLDLVSPTGPLLFLALGDDDHDPEDTWHYGDRDRGVANYLGVVDGGGNDRYVGDQAVPREVGRPSLLVDLEGDDDFISTRSFTQGYGYLGSVGVLWNAGGDDRYVADSHAQGAAYKHGIGLLLDDGGNDSYNPVPGSHPGLIDYMPTIPNPAHGVGDRGDLLASIHRPYGTMPGAHMVQGAGDEGIGILVSGGGYDAFAAGQRAQGYGQHGTEKAEDYAFPGDIEQCGNPGDAVLDGLGEGFPPNPFAGPEVLLCWMGVGASLNPDNWDPDNSLCSAGVPCPDEGLPRPPDTEPLTTFLDAGPRYGPGVGLLLKANGSAAYHASGLAQGASGPDGRGMLLDLDGGFVASVLQQGQAFSDGGQAGLLAGGSHSIWIESSGQGASQRSDEHPEYPRHVDDVRPREDTSAAIYARTQGESVCVEAARCGSPVTLNALEPPNRLDLVWQEDSDVNQAHRVLQKPNLTLAVDFDIESMTDVSQIEGVAVTQPWPTEGSGADCPRTDERPLTAAIKIGSATLDDLQTDATITFEVDLAETVGDQPVYPAGCHVFTIFARGLDADGNPATPWDRLEGKATLLPSPRLALHSPDEIHLVTNLDNQGLTLDLASGETLPLASEQDLMVDVRLVPDSSLGVGTVHLGGGPLSAPGTPEGFHVTSDQVENGHFRWDAGSDCSEQDFVVGFENIPDEAAELAVFLLHNAPDDPTPRYHDVSWKLPAESSSVQHTLRAPCPGDAPAPIDREYLLHAYALESPTNLEGAASGLSVEEEKRSLLHGNVLARTSMQIKASPTPRAFDWGPLGQAVGVQERFEWNLTEEFKDVQLPAETIVYDIHASSRWANPGGQNTFSLGTIVVDPTLKETDLELAPQPLEAESLAHWKRTDDLTIRGGIELDDEEDHALPTRLALQSVAIGEHQADRPLPDIDPTVEGNVLHREIIQWTFVEGEDDVEIINDHEDSPIQIRLIEQPDDGGGTQSTLAWEVSSLDLLPSSEAFRGGLVEVQARVADQAGNMPGWGSDQVTRQRVFFDGVAPVLTDFVAAGGTDATNEQFPIDLTAALVDDSGLDPATVRAFVLDGASELQEMPFSQSEMETQGGRTQIGFTWDEEGQGPEEGAYQFVFEAHDRVGNHLLVLPGVPIEIDRTAPTLDNLQTRIVEDQAWVGGGTNLAVSVDTTDPRQSNVRSGIDHVHAVFEGDDGRNASVELVQPDEASPEHNHTLTVPRGLTDAPAQISINVTACDRAGNCATSTSQEFTYYAQPPWIVEEEARERGESIAYDIRTDRPTTIDEERTFLEDPNTTAMTTPTIESNEVNHTLIFDSLRPETAYHGQLALRDEAGYLTLHPLQFDTTQEVQGTLVTLDPLHGTVSGEIEITGTVVQSPGADLSLHIQESDGNPEDPIFSLSPRFDRVEVPAEATERFSFPVDTREAPFHPGTEDTITFIAILDGEASQWEAKTEVHIDNAPPRFDPLIQGPTPVGGWYNGPITVDANAKDATEPITYSAGLNEGEPEDRRRITVREDGTHNITFRASDAVVPPNAIQHNMTVRIDRTIPVLNASINLTDAASNNPVVPLAIDGDQRLSGPSGLNGFRINPGEGWTPWMQTPPEHIVLNNATEGERWIEVQLRDNAGNIAHEAMSFVLDRTPPEIMEVRWIGANSSGLALKVIAIDRMDGPGLPAGVDEVRFAIGQQGAWSPWKETSGETTLQIPDTVQEGDLVRVQARDAAGNKGPVRLLHVTENLNRADAEDPETEQRVRAPDVNVFSFLEPTLDPPHGTEETRFEFRVAVHPWSGQNPQRVWVTLDDQEIELERRGLISGGAALYTATSTLEVVDIEDHPFYRFHAAYEQGTVSTEPETGPMVSAISGQAHEPGIMQRVPMVSLGTALVAVLAVSVGAWRWQGGRNG